MANDREAYRRRIVRILVDAVCLGLAWLPILILSQWVKPYYRGFYCDDQSLMFPYKSSTIPSALLYGVGYGLTCLTILVIELVRYLIGKKNAMELPNFEIGRLSINHYLWVCYTYIGFFLFGAAINQTLTDIGKYTIGRLRPHFLSVCRPDYSLINITCTSPYTHMFIKEDICTGTDSHLLKEMRMSFPSGHSSFACYSMLYLALYLQFRMTWNGSKLMKHLFQAVVICMAIYTGLSRISDYKHHWSDVLTGGLLGGIVSLITVFMMSDLYNTRNHSQDLILWSDFGSYRRSTEEPSQFGSQLTCVTNATGINGDSRTTVS